MLGPGFKSCEVWRDERGDELVLVADERALRNHHGVLELVFDGLWGDHFAAGGLEQFLLAVGDVEESVVIETGDVAGAEEAVGVEAFRIRGRLVPVADKDRWAADEEFAIVGKFELDVGKRLADGAHAVDHGIVEGDDRRGFCEAVALPNGDAGGGEPLCRVDAEGRAAGNPDAHASAKGFAHLAVDKLVGDFPKERGRLASVVDGVAVRAFRR